METQRTKTQASRPSKAAMFDLKVEFDGEVDGRWIADIPVLPGVTVYGRTRKQALTAVEVLALRVIADRIEHGEALLNNAPGGGLMAAYPG